MNDCSMLKVVGAVDENAVELAFRIGNRFLCISECDDGFDYTVYDESYSLLDGGVDESDGCIIDIAKQIVYFDLVKCHKDENGNEYRTPYQGNVTIDTPMELVDIEEVLSLVEDAYINEVAKSKLTA